MRESQDSGSSSPQADVVLDRWHLLRNYSDALERFVARRHATWRAILRDHERAQAGVEDPPCGVDRAAVELPPAPRHRPSRRIQEQRHAKRQARLELFNRVHELRQLGRSKAAIAREVGLDPQTVKSYLKRDAPPDFTRKTPTPSHLDPHVEYLRGRWMEGCRNAAHLTKELRERGYQGSLRTVMRYVHAWRDANPATPPRPPPPRLPAPRRLAWLLLTHDPDHDPAIITLQQISPHAQHEIALAREGHHALKTRDLNAWRTWSEKILHSNCTDLKHLAIGLQAEGAAFTNAPELPYSNGPTEGHVNRLKLIKRTMYGRASFPLLRKKILYQDT